MRLILVLCLPLLLAACTQDPADAPATQLRDATQKPIDATNQAVKQVEQTNQRMDSALDQLDSQEQAQQDAANGN